MTDTLASIRQRIRDHIIVDEAGAIARLVEAAQLDAAARAAIAKRAEGLVEQVRSASSPGMLESFLAEYTLSTTEGIALMCLAEALLRVPDTKTIDDLIEDKITPSAWTEHIGRANSPLVNMSSLALALTGQVLRDADGIAGALKSLVQRIGEPVIRSAVLQAMKILGSQFVLGRDIAEATKIARKQEKDGFTYSYDMLGEAARTNEDALRYHAAYAHSIKALHPLCTQPEVRDNPGISVKLSAIHPRYEFAKRERVMSELVPRTLELALMAKAANMGFNIDAEEADRLDLSLDIIETVLADERLAGWEGFGVVVQAYGTRAGDVIDWLEALAEKLDRRIMVRLVKGAYWDSEIKRAQIAGLKGFPVFTRKAATDVSYIANARKLLLARKRIYPQFASHNAHTAAAILHLAAEMGVGKAEYEFQRLHGMGERLHDILMKEPQTHCRIYAPVGKHADLLAYLVRRLLENGANGSFVNMIADRNVPASAVARDPFDAVTGDNAGKQNAAVRQPADLYGADRRNSTGWDLTDPVVFADLEFRRSGFRTHQWSAGPMIAGAVEGGATDPVRNPANPGDTVGSVTSASLKDIDAALAAAEAAKTAWGNRPVAERANILRRIADLYEANAVEFFALAGREAGKSLSDAVGEVREAVDFLRYYAAEAESAAPRAPLGTFACVSPWNFPLAIFTGQIAAALVTGNTVVAKPAPQTPLIAARAVALMHEAGVPHDVIQLLPGDGITVGGTLVADPRIAGVCFTGSLNTAKAIDRAMAKTLHPNAPLIAETGGLNAMIVDSTALPEQAVRDIASSAFQSAGQRCSALRVLFVQEEAEERVLDMLYGAMDELAVGDPWALATDIGPVIDQPARAKIEDHVAAHAIQGSVTKRIPAPENGIFVAPTVIKIAGLHALKEEIFGPVLHVATFKAAEIDEVVDTINASGFGLTFGLHTRIDGRVERITDRIRVGNIYVNRNQIGAVVGSQPFGGEGLSGTGPKAGGPHYLTRFTRGETGEARPAEDNPLPAVSIGKTTAILDKLRTSFEREALVQAALHAGDSEAMPGPTGESNTLTLHPRGVVLCLGPDAQSASLQAGIAQAHGNAALVIAPGAEAIASRFAEQGMVIAGIEGRLPIAAIEAGLAVDAVACFGDETLMRQLRLAVSRRDGAILPIIASPDDAIRLTIERHICIDTTASGGNAQLLATASAA